MKRVWVCVGVVVFLFGFCVFKNIQYPLLWNDEGETAVYGKQIIKYGYPKVYDGKNTMFHFVGVFSDFAYRKDIDAFVGNVWGQFYAAVPFLLVADLVNDPYVKTYILRGGFAVFGFLGVLLTPFLFFRLLGKKGNGRLYLFYLLIEVTSIPLILMIRQFRVYPIILLVLPLVLYAVINFEIEKSNKQTGIVLIILLFILFNMSYLVYASLMLTICVVYCYKWLVSGFNLAYLTRFIKEDRWRYYLLSGLTILPVLVFHRIPTAVSTVSSIFGNYQFSYSEKVGIVSGYLFFGEVLLPGTILLVYLFNKRNVNAKARKIISWLVAFVFVSIFVNAVSPVYFTRYYIHLQPLVTLIFVFGIVNVDLGQVRNKWRQSWRWVLSGVLGLFWLVVALSLRGYWIVNYIGELRKPIKGTVDVVYDYIYRNYINREELVIATNYEEMPLMYYLKSKVIVGFSGVNYNQEKSLTPDMLIMRRSVASMVKSLEMVDSFRNNTEYKKTVLPVVDYPVNNIPELVVYPRHIFSTLTSTGINSLVIYERK